MKRNSVTIHSRMRMTAGSEADAGLTIHSRMRMTAGSEADAGLASDMLPCVRPNLYIPSECRIRR